MRQWRQIAAGSPEPWDGIRGRMPPFSMDSRRSTTRGRTPEFPLARTLALRSIRERVCSSESHSPTPAQWLRMRLTCKSDSFAGEMRTPEPQIRGSP
jgi:hypothetical protein